MSHNWLPPHTISYPMETNEFSRSNMLLNSKDENLKFRISSGIILYKGNYIPRITAS